MENTVSLLADLATKHKLVPFLGAGCSKVLLGVDWDSIRDCMVEELNIQSDDHLEVAQMYVNQFGRDGLCSFLSQRLLIDTFNVEKGTADIKIMSLGLGLIYTTNQDNVLEKCFEEFGRVYKVITTIDDLAESNPLDWLLIKYHGDLTVPESVVFTSDDYQLRIAQQDHFLNIRLRADLLERNLLFIGYGMRDKNILGLLEGLQRAFYRRLPQSYLIAFQSNEEFEKECAGYGVQVIDPRKEYPGIVDPQEAFDRFLSELAEQTIRKRYENEESMLFPKLPRARRVLTLSELSVVEQVVIGGSANQAIRTFRNTIDAAVIPRAFEERVVDCFVTMSRLCSNSDEASQINGAAFNIHLNEMMNRLIVQACVLTTINLHSKGRGVIPHFLPHTPNFPEQLNVLAGAQAIEFLLLWGRTVGDPFRDTLTSLMELRSASVDSFPSEVQTWIRERIDRAWGVPTPCEHPVSRQQRLQGLPGMQRTQPVSEQLLNEIPRSFFRPLEV